MSKANKQALLSPENYIKTKARSLPINKCYINDDWEVTGLANIIVMRRHSNQNVTYGIYLVDLLCLGVKDSFYHFNQDEDTLSGYITNGFYNFVTIDYALAHNIIYGALAFASEHGFDPSKGWKLCQYLLEEDDELIPMIDIEFGKNERPIYIAGPNDDDIRIKSITNTLKRTAGEGNYEVIMGERYDELEE